MQLKAWKAEDARRVPTPAPFPRVVLYILISNTRLLRHVYVPRKLTVHGNAVATANNIAASETLFRLGIAAQLISQAGFIFVALALYDLLKGINRRDASLMVTLVVVAIPIAFLNELNSIAALVLVSAGLTSYP